jgi:hypothetical protein
VQVDPVLLAHQLGMNRIYPPPLQPDRIFVGTPDGAGAALAGKGGDRLPLAGSYSYTKHLSSGIW